MADGSVHRCWMLIIPLLMAYCDTLSLSLCPATPQLISKRNAPLWSSPSPHMNISWNVRKIKQVRTQCNGRMKHDTLTLCTCLYVWTSDYFQQSNTDRKIGRRKQACKNYLAESDEHSVTKKFFSPVSLRVHCVIWLLEDYTMRAFPIRGRPTALTCLLRGLRTFVQHDNVSLSMIKSTSLKSENTLVHIICICQ